MRRRAAITFLALAIAAGCSPSREPMSPSNGGYHLGPNTGDPIGMDASTEVARQEIHHSTRYPSRIVLPVIPR